MRFENSTQKCFNHFETTIIVQFIWKTYERWITPKQFENRYTPQKNNAIREN